MNKIIHIFPETYLRKKNNNKRLKHTLLAKSFVMAEVRSSICVTASLSDVKLPWSWSRFSLRPAAQSFSCMTSRTRTSRRGCRFPRWAARPSSICCTVSHWNRKYSSPPRRKKCKQRGGNKKKKRLFLFLHSTIQEF